MGIETSIRIVLNHTEKGKPSTNEKTGETTTPLGSVYVSFDELEYLMKKGFTSAVFTREGDNDNIWLQPNSFTAFHEEVFNQALNVVNTFWAKNEDGTVVVKLAFSPNANGYKADKIGKYKYESSVSKPQKPKPTITKISDNDIEVITPDTDKKSRKGK